ncbi:arrestin domain-containing protein 17 isoform X5 [Diabrotica virgifera virgifera]|uniref:Arrestin-like N-terminal domain-containing protein n=1 Tax=Diabrotica virgifera virgifera TaxID=50390 RepID=A0ABM5JTM8_DIAVI|nr:arrestin domain-containing protein 17 isoform X5 [Diabrotica virgifera virgifera]
MLEAIYRFSSFGFILSYFWTVRNRIFITLAKVNMTCTVELSSGNIYNPGSTIYGKAFCQFYAQEDFNVIKCTFRGEEATCWTTTERHYDRFKKRKETRTVTHQGQNTFVTIDVILSNEGQLPHGQYEYPFSIRLPPNLAGSFQGPYGTIKYFFVFIVDKGIRSNYMCEVPLTVISPVDFNKIRDELQLQPTSYQDEKILGCCCCASDPLTMEMRLEKEAFAMGEKMKVNVRIVNLSNTTVPRVELNLQQAKAVVPGFHTNLYVQTGDIMLGTIPLIDIPTETSKLLDPAPAYTYEETSQNEKNGILFSNIASAPEEEVPSAPPKSKMMN